MCAPAAGLTTQSGRCQKTDGGEVGGCLRGGLTCSASRCQGGQPFPPLSLLCFIPPRCPSGGPTLPSGGEPGSSLLQPPAKAAGPLGPLLSPRRSREDVEPHGGQSWALPFLSHVSTRKQKVTQRGPRGRTMNYSSPGPGWGCSQRLLFPS